MTKIKDGGILTTIKEYILLSIGMMTYALGWSIFILPNNLVGGGGTGICSIIHYATGINVGISYFILNLFLLILGLCFLGKSFGFKTVYAIFLASFLLAILENNFPPAIIETLAIKNGKLMSTIMGGIMSGFGIGLAISQGGSSGGTDIIALIINKYHSVSPGRMILAMDVVIILSSLIFPSYTADGSLLPWADKITTVVYGLILVTINGFVIDLYLSGFNQSIQLFILSDKYEEIADSMVHDLHRGVTVLDGKGWYTKAEKKVILLVARKADLSIILRYVKFIDPNAFLTIFSVNGVYGRGFDAIKVNPRKKKKLNK